MVQTCPVEPGGVVADACHRAVFIRSVGRAAVPAPNIPKDGGSGRRTEDRLFHPVRFVVKGRDRLPGPVGARNKPDRAIGLGKVNHEEIDHQHRRRNILICDLVQRIMKKLPDVRMEMLNFSAGHRIIPTCPGAIKGVAAENMLNQRQYGRQINKLGPFRMMNL